jgi:hypothetical protein
LEYLGWRFNTSSQGAAASVVGGKHTTTACELGTQTTASNLEVILINYKVLDKVNL